VAFADILLPTHRRPHTLAYSIASVLAQSHRDFQLHVVGDGSGDETESVVRGFRDPRIRFHRFPKAPGFGYALRNQVLRQTSAPYVAYMTDDDLWFPDHLEQGLRRLERDGLALVAFRPCHVKDAGGLDPYFFSFDWRSGRPSTLLRNLFMGSVECVHRRSVLEVAGYWNEALSRFGDREFYNRIRTSGLPSAYVDEVTVVRFYAMHWDRRYSRLVAPPQKDYLALVEDPEWCASVRGKAGERHRTLRVRCQQWLDFLQFGVRQGPKFGRFAYQRLRAPSPRGALLPDVEV
jgi:glycosyltransferase involved in cell wall biosynthesis